MASRPRSSRSSRPVRSSRTAIQSYHEDSSSDGRNDEDAESDEERARRLSLSLRPRDSHRIPATYREQSSDDEFDGDLSEAPEPIMPVDASSRYERPHTETPSQSTRSRAPGKRTVKTRSQARRSQRPPKKKPMELGRPLNKRRKVDEGQAPFIGSGVIPPWQSLPYHILFDIFVRASFPLADEKTATRNSSVQWLVNLSLLCRSFHEPALAALYHCPPLLPPAKTHGLLSLLSRPYESLSTNYPHKIQELDVDVETLLLYKSGPTLGYFELHRLIEKTPQVKKLRLYHSDDSVTGLPPWQINRSKWIYPEILFSAIVSTSIRLRCWDWNSRFMDTKKLLRLMMAKHLQPAFSGLRELKLLHISEDIEDDNGSEVYDEMEVVLATALKELPELCHLDFFECSIVNEHLLPNLPPFLTSLTMTNCPNITAPNMSAFLSSHGQNLRELTLCHNRHLSLSFIVGLAQSCQRLEKFKVDISMHDWSSYHDVEPHFRDLLGRSEVPTWPTTLQDLELQQLRKWDYTTAETFFTSLIDAAPMLRDLRRLVITAILKIGWRDRATFREKWISRLEKVFLRQSAPPNPNLRTIPRPCPPEAVPMTQHEDVSVDCSHPDHVDGTLSGPSTPSKRKSARLAQRKFSEGEDNGSPSPSSRAPAGYEDNYSPLLTQGMCDIVSVRIDNQRPTETQFNEEDFLDDEISGDEDWNGYDADLGDGGHAW